VAREWPDLMVSLSDNVTWRGRGDEWQWPPRGRAVAPDERAWASVWRNSSDG
jgi:hypothetical protein